MTKRKRVGLDFDDVLIDFIGGVTVFHNENYATSYSKDDVTGWELSKLWECSPEEAHRRMEEYVHSSHHSHISPIIGAVDAVKRLKEKCDLFIITARDESINEQTFALIDEHFPKSFESVHFLHKDGKNFRGTKGEVCTELDIDIFVEDSLTNAQHTSDAGIKTLLFDAPWNQIDKLPKNVTRVFSWDEILKEIES